MKKLSLSILLINKCLSIYSQPTIQWQHSYGGNKNDGGLCLSNCIYGGFILAGLTNNRKLFLN